MPDAKYDLKARALATMALVRAPNLTFDQQYESLEEALREAQLKGIRIGLAETRKRLENACNLRPHKMVHQESIVGLLAEIDPASLMEKG